MAFSIGYTGVCSKNITHLYTTRSEVRAARRKPRAYNPQFLEIEYEAWRRKQHNRRFFDYDSKHDIYLPRAGAFRAKDPKYVETIVDRLFRKTRPVIDPDNYGRHTICFQQWDSMESLASSRGRLYASKERLFGSKDRLFGSKDRVFGSKDRVFGSKEKLTGSREKLDTSPRVATKQDVTHTIGDTTETAAEQTLTLTPVQE